MAVLFNTAFPHDAADDAPIVDTDFPDYPVTVLGSGAAGALIYKLDQYINTGSSALVDSTTGDRYLQTTITPIEEVWTRMYVRIAANPTGTDARLMRWRAGGNNTVASVFVSTTGHFFVSSGTGATPIWTSTGAFTNQWVRLEWRAFCPATGTAEQNLRIYYGTNLHGIDQTANYEASGVQAATQYPGTLSILSLGNVGTATAVGRYYMDAIRSIDTGWVGGIAGAPVASFTTSPATTSGTAPFTVAFTNTSTGADSYQWSWNDGTASSTATSPSHTFQKAGTFLVDLLATDTVQGQTSVASKEVTVTAPVTAALASYDYNVVGGAVGNEFTDATLTDLGGGTATLTNVNVTKGSFALAIDSTFNNRGYELLIPTQPTLLFFRQYVRVTKSPIAGEMVLAAARQSGATLARVSVNQHGKWSLWRGDSGPYGSLAGESTAAITHGALIRMEWSMQAITGAPGNQELRLYVGRNRHGTTPNVVIKGTMPGTAIDSFRFGSLATCNGKVTIDESVLNTGDWVGAVASPNALTGVPIVGFMIDKLTIAMNDGVTITNLTTGTPTSYAWTYGNGSGTETTNTVARTYAAGGTFTVSQTATNASGASAPASLVVTALDPARGAPTANVRSAGAWKTQPATATNTYVNYRLGGRWETGRIRVYKNGQWSSNDPIGSTGGGTGGGGWGAGTASTGTWFGSSLGNPGTAQQSYDAVIATFGQIEIVRSFNGGWPQYYVPTVVNGTTIAGVDPKGYLYQNNPAIKVQHTSIKMGGTEYGIAGGTDAAAKTTLYNRMLKFTRSVPNDERIWLTCNHEPEQEIKAGSWTLAEWRAGQQMWHDAVVQARGERTTNASWLKYLQIIQGVSVNGDNGNPDNWHAAGMDAYGVDPYYLNTNQAAARYYDANGYRWAVCEFGRNGALNDRQKRDYMLSQWDATMNLTPTKPQAMQYWQSNVGGYDVLLDRTNEPLTTALWTSICDTGFPPTSLWP